METGAAINVFSSVMSNQSELTFKWPDQVNTTVVPQFWSVVNNNIEGVGAGSVLQITLLKGNTVSINM
jgi:hypothetical protein